MSLLAPSLRRTNKAKTTEITYRLHGMLFFVFLFPIRWSSLWLWTLGREVLVRSVWSDPGPPPTGAADVTAEIFVRCVDKVLLGRVKPQEKSVRPYSRIPFFPLLQPNAYNVVMCYSFAFFPGGLTYIFLANGIVSTQTPSPKCDRCDAAAKGGTLTWRLLWKFSRETLSIHSAMRYSLFIALATGDVALLRRIHADAASH